jgi:hypothetical protein
MDSDLDDRAVGAVTKVIQSTHVVGAPILRRRSPHDWRVDEEHSFGHQHKGNHNRQKHSLDPS